MILIFQLQIIFFIAPVLEIAASPDLAEFLDII